MVKSNMMRRKNNSKKARLSFEIFTLKGLRRFKSSELVVAEVMARIKEKKWRQDERLLQICGAVQRGL